MKKIILITLSFYLFCAFANIDNEVKLEGIWVHEKTKDQTGQTFIVIRGDEVQLYLESYWTAGYNQYFGGEKLVANNSLFIHVNNYLTISPNTGTVVRYRNCPNYNLQRIIVHDIDATNLKIEIIPGSSIYNSFGFFDDKVLNFRKISLEEFEKMDPIIDKIPELLLSNETKIKDCSAITEK